MDIKFLLKASFKYISGVLLVFLVLFIPAGTLKFWNAWLFMAIIFIPILITGIFLIFKNPELLRKRLNSKEKESEQKSVVLLSGLMFIGGFIVAGLDFRFNWLRLPCPLTIAATVIFIFSYLLYIEVMRENTHLPSTIEVRENQRVL